MVTAGIAFNLTSCGPTSDGKTEFPHGNPSNSRGLDRHSENCGFEVDSRGERISWKGKLPIVLYLSKSFPRDYIPQVEEAIQIWEDALNRKLFQLMVGDAPAQLSEKPSADGISALYWLSEWTTLEKNKDGEQGRAEVYALDNQYIEGDILINATFDKVTFFTTENDNTNDLHRIHLTSLLVHELGHVLGLKDNDQKTSVMYGYLAENEIRTKVSTKDIKNLKCEYE